MTRLLKMFISLFIFLSIYACKGIISIPTNAQTPQLFIVDAYPDKRLEHRFILFSPDTGKVTISTVDLSNFGWDTCFCGSDMNGSEGIQYNPITHDVIFLLFPIPDMEVDGGWKPDNVLPDPPFQFAIYQTDTTFTSPQQLYSSNDKNISIYHLVLNPVYNTLLLDVHSYHKQEIWAFNIVTNKLYSIAEVPLAVEENWDLIESSGLKITPDGKILYQLILYKKKNVRMQMLYLLSIDLENNILSLQMIDSGDDFTYGIKGLSQNGQIISYYNDFNLRIKDLKKGVTIELPIEYSQLHNLTIYTSPDGRKVLIGLLSGWDYYNLSNKSYNHTYFDMPVLWDPSSRYILGLNNNKYVVFDTQTKHDINIAVTPSKFTFSIESAQWR